MPPSALPLRVLACPDSFKGSLTAAEAAAAMARGARRALPGALVTMLPLADGGEGTLEALAGPGARRRTGSVTGPLGAPVEAAYLILADGTAVI
ncbi:MAG: glycerate kinase, partial [bacterium]